MKLKKLLIRYIMLCILLAGLTACQLNTSQNSNIPAKNLNFPADYEYYSLVKKDNNLAAFIPSYSQPPGEVHYAYGYFEVGGEGIYDLALPDDPKCNLSTDYSVLGMFPDSRLQVWKQCNKDTYAEKYLMAYDWNTNVLEEISGPLPIGPTSSSWNPEQTKGIASLSDAFASGTLYSIRAGGFDPLDITITDNGLSWNLKDDFPDFQGSDSGTTGNVEKADWSPDGKSIAFFASPDAIGEIGSSRFGVEYKLYIMDAENLNPKPVLDGVHYSHIIAWSPDSQYIAFIGEYGLFRQDGIWLYSIKENTAANIAKGNFRDILWNDRNSLVALQCDKDFVCSEINEYDLSNLIK